MLKKLCNEVILDNIWVSYMHDRKYCNLVAHLHERSRIAKRHIYTVCRISMDESSCLKSKCKRNKALFNHMVYSRESEHI